MRKFVVTKDMPKKEWLHYRKMGITGTDAGAITGMNPYVSAFHVYQDKVSDETEEFDNESMRQGRDLEQYVAERFMEKTGKRVKRTFAMYQNEEHPIMLADFDRLVIGENAGLECKTVNAYSADKWKDGQIPLHYQMQCQHYLAVSGCDAWYIAALVFGKEFIVHKIERDEELIQSLITIEEYFWEEHVMKQIPPAPDGSENYSKMLDKQYKGRKDYEIILLGMDEELRRRAELDELIDKLSKERTVIDQQIKGKMGEASYAMTKDYRIAWVPSVQNRIDSQKLREEQPQIYGKYLKEINSRRFTIKLNDVA